MTFPYPTDDGKSFFMANTDLHSSAGQCSVICQTFVIEPLANKKNTARCYASWQYLYDLAVYLHLPITELK